MVSQKEAADCVPAGGAGSAKAVFAACHSEKRHQKSILYDSADWADRVDAIGLAKMPWFDSVSCDS